MAHSQMSDAFLQRHGFTHIGTEQLFALELPLQKVAPPFALPAHIRITTLAELLSHDSDAMEQVCTLHAAISLDVPMPDELIVTLSKFRRLLGRSVNPHHYLLAFVDDQLIGESILMARRRRQRCDVATRYRGIAGIPRFRCRQNPQICCNRISTIAGDSRTAHVDGNKQCADSQSKLCTGIS
jgi:hypothetical protein